MSIIDYEISRRLSLTDPSFASLIMAAIRKADSDNLLLLQHTFPAIFEELRKRYAAPGGLVGQEQKIVGTHRGCKGTVIMRRLTDGQITQECHRCAMSTHQASIGKDGSNMPAQELKFESMDDNEAHDEEVL